MSRTTSCADLRPPARKYLRSHAPCLALAIWLFTGPISPVVAQEALLENPPFDQVILNDANKNLVLNVYPLDFPDRRVPSSRQGELIVQLLDRPGEEFKVNWSDIRQVKLYEQLLLERAAELTNNKQFDEAFEFFSRLITDYPQMAGLDAAINSFLRQNALALYQQAEYDRALAVLGSLHDRSPQYSGLATALERVASEIIKQRLRQQDYAGARAVLDMLTNQFGEVASQAIREWQQRFSEAAQSQASQAEAFLSQEKYADADRAARRALTIWPELESARKILQEIAQQHPQVVVGVFERAPQNPQRRIDSWADLRVSPLQYPTICQIVGYGEGGIYSSPYGDVLVEDTDRGRQLLLDVHPGAALVAPPHVLARTLLAMARPGHPHYRSDYGSLCRSVEIERDSRVRVELVRPHVRPEALLTGATLDLYRHATPFARIRSDAQSERFQRQGAASHGIQAITEIALEGDSHALAALVRGEVSVLDRVPPWQLAQVQSVQDVSVGQYLLPTIHVLIPNPKSRLLAQREFRRALVFGIDRRRILEQLICGGAPKPGFEVLSGPFPPGASPVDPVRYAYDTQIKPRPYSPRLAATLSMVAATSLAEMDAKLRGKEPQAETPDGDAGEQAEDAVPAENLPEIPTLVLAHSSDALARTVCEAIAQGLRAVGIPIELRELTTDELLSDSAEYDLRYAELAVWEPVVDAHTLFGPDGLVPGSAAMTLALKNLETATNWVDVRRQLNNIHRIAHNDLTLIPLWQTINYFAYRAELTGLRQSPVTLYQHVVDWQLEPR